MGEFRLLYSGVKKTIEPHLSVISNLGYLTVLQLCNLILPLVTYPYLLRIVGANLYGQVIFAQALMSYLVVLINFGFNITATKQISLHRGDNEKINEICSSVYIIKGILFIISTLILNFIVWRTDNKQYLLLFNLTLWMCLYEFLFPIWYFQGMEKMKYITFFTLISRILFVVCIFTLIKTKSDYLLIPIFYGLGALVSSFFSIWILYKDNVKILYQPARILLIYMNMTYIMAISYGANLFKTNFNLIVIKLLFTFKEVAYFDLALKIINIGITFLDLISQAIFPKMARSKDINLLKKVLIISVILGIVMMIFIQALSPFIVQVLGNRQMAPAIKTVVILAINFPIYIVGALLGRNCLLIHGYDTQILLSMIYSSIVYFILTYCFGFVLHVKEIHYYAIIYVFAFLLETIYRFIICRKHRLI